MHVGGPLHVCIAMNIICIVNLYAYFMNIFNTDNYNAHIIQVLYSRLCSIYPCVIETVKDWCDCEQLAPIEVGQNLTNFKVNRC